MRGVEKTFLRVLVVDSPSAGEVWSAHISETPASASRCAH